MEKRLLLRNCSGLVEEKDIYVPWDGKIFESVPARIELPPEQITEFVSSTELPKLVAAFQ